MYKDKVIMDRNLGARSNAVNGNNAAAYNSAGYLYYFYGRKDPFPWNDGPYGYGETVVVFRSPRPVPSASAHALSPVWTASSSASNTFWRTRTHRTSSAVMSRLRMASAAPMLPQRLRGKMGGWKVGI